MDLQGKELSPHVLILPHAAQGHVNSMLILAELLCLRGIQVTFLLTEFFYSRLLRHSDVRSRFDRYSGFRFVPISDGLPEDHPRSADKIGELFFSFRANLKSILRDVLISNRQSSNAPKMKCVIADAIVMSLARDVCEEIGIPIICFCTSSPCDLWPFFCVPKLVEAGEIPFPGNNLDEPVASVPGMESFLRRRDLPSFFRTQDLADWGFQMLLNEIQQIPKAQALILNTFESLEAPVLSQLRSQCPRIYSIGPLHAHLKSKLKLQQPINSNSFWEEDRSCLKWLDSQPSRSVIYVSFGTVMMITKDQHIEFWHGLVNSGKSFLWVIRPDVMALGDEVEYNQIPKELLEATKERGYIVDWAPQKEVLAHQAIGGFLTHSGWNSIMESVVAGVPMICWPCLSDQLINSRFVGEVWRLGLDMKDSCDRATIEKVVRDLMDVRGEEFRQSAHGFASLAEESISEGGSSYCDLEHLIRDIRLIT